MLTVYDVMVQLGVCEATVRRWIKDGRLAAIKSDTGRVRIPPEAFAEYLNERWKPIVPREEEPAA